MSEFKRSPLGFINKSLLAAAIAAGLTSALPAPVVAKTVQAGDPDGLFRSVGTFDVIAGNSSSVAEIVDVTVNGKQLV